MKKFFKNKDLQKRILFTLTFLLLFRVVSFIPVPFVNRESLKAMSEVGAIAYVSMFSGGALSNFTVMATGISSYISASIIVQLLTYGVQRFHDLAKSPGGDRVIKKITIILGVISSFVISLGTTITLQRTFNILTNDSWYVFFLIAIIHSAGTGFAVWIGETITKKGFGNGVSLLILVNIVSNIPNMIMNTKESLANESLSDIGLGICLIIIIFVGFGIVVFDKSERQIKIKYTKAIARGKTSFGSTSGYLPIKLNMSGVMPIIFASTIMQLITIISSAISGGEANKWIAHGTIGNGIIMAGLIFFFSYFYNALIFNPMEISNNIQSNGGVIPGIRPGLATGEYIKKINQSLTFFGSIYLAIIALIPSIVFAKIGFNGLATTSLMILVGVGIEISEKIKLELETGVLGGF